MGFRPCSSCGNFGRAHFSRKQYGEGIALPCFGGCDGWMWEGWSPTTTHLCGSGWQYSKRVEKLDKSHLCSTAGAKPLSEVTWFANARFLHFTRVYFFLNGMIVLIFLILYFWFSKKLIDQRYMAMMMMRVSHTHDVIGSFLCFRHSFSFCFCCLQIHFGSSSIWKLLAYELHFK